MTDLVICLLYYGLLAVTVGLCLAHAVLANARTRRLARIFLVVGPLPAVVTSVYALIRIFIGISPGVDPSHKATIWAASITEAVNCTAYVILVLLLGGTPYLIGQWRMKRRERAEEGEESRS